MVKAIGFALAVWAFAHAVNLIELNPAPLSASTIAIEEMESN